MIKLTMTQEQKIQEVLTRGVENIYPDKASFEELLNSGKKIRLYCGFDPTAPTLHVGSAVQIKKLAQFQALGHEVILLIGDFTGMIGDPTDKSKTRPKLTREQLLKNAENYKEQAGKILDFSGENPAKIMYNSKWNDKLSFVDLIELSSNFTAQQMLARDMFKKRIEEGKDLYLHEFLYPLAQAYDSVVMDVDLEIGGNDQMFNMLCGRTLMKKMKDKEKFVLTTKLLVDPKGEKMGKTTGNVVALDEKSNEMFGQIMSWTDGLIIPGFEFCTDLPMEEIEKMDQEMKDNKLNPRDAKAKLAKEIISTYHSSKDADNAEKEFNKIFKNKDKPTEMEVYKTDKSKVKIIDILLYSKLVSSKGEAKRLIEQGGVKVDNEKVEDCNQEIIIKDKTIIQAGKRKFVQVRV